MNISYVAVNRSHWQVWVQCQQHDYWNLGTLVVSLLWNFHQALLLLLFVFFASWLECSTPDRVVRVRALAGDTVLCSWARYFTLRCLSPPRCINGYPRNAGGNPAMDWHPIQGGVEILLVASCYGNRRQTPAWWAFWLVRRGFTSFTVKLLEFLDVRSLIVCQVFRKLPLLSRISVSSTILILLLTCLRKFLTICPILWVVCNYCVAFQLFCVAHWHLDGSNTLSTNRSTFVNNSKI